MSVLKKLEHELKSLIVTFVYFLVWIGALVLIKKIILDEYHMQFRGMAAALIMALVLSKVVLLMAPISL